MRSLVAASLVLLASALCASASSPKSTSKQKSGPPMTAGVGYAPVTFKDLTGWDEDDKLAAFKAFLQSCPAVLKVAERPDSPQAPLRIACRTAQILAEQRVTRRTARIFFEQQFTPHRVVHNGPSGLFTGYYEPVINGSRTRTDRFTVPLYRRPLDLPNIDDAQRSTVPAKSYFTRAEIDAGALDGSGLELMWIVDEVERFFLQVEGSGRIRLPDGSLVRVTYDGKNGHPYTSIGRALIERGEIDPNRMSQAALNQWLRADRSRGQAIMQQNASYVFFRELPSDAASAIGTMNIPLTPGRSLAVDASLHPIGAPVYVVASSLTHATSGGAFQRLMIAQDVGSAIKGAERGDLYFGSGDRAGRLASVTKHEGRMFILLPKQP